MRREKFGGIERAFSLLSADDQHGTGERSGYDAGIEKCGCLKHAAGRHIRGRREASDAAVGLRIKEFRAVLGKQLASGGEERASSYQHGAAVQQRSGSYETNLRHRRIASGPA